MNNKLKSFSNKTICVKKLVSEYKHNSIIIKIIICQKIVIQEMLKIGTYNNSYIIKEKHHKFILIIKVLITGN